MPYLTELTEDCRGILRVGRGLITGEDLLAASVASTQLVQNTANFQYELVDLSAVTELRITPTELEQIAAQDRIAAKYRPHAIVAIIALREDTFEIAKQWQQHTSDLGWTTHISRSRADTLRWLEERVGPLKLTR